MVVLDLIVKSHHRQRQRLQHQDRAPSEEFHLTVVLMVELGLTASYLAGPLPALHQVLLHVPMVAYLHIAAQMEDKVRTA